MNTIRQWLRSLAWVVLHRWPDVEDRREAWHILATCHPADDEIDAALRAAFADCGVNIGSYATDLDLDGKRYEVLHHAAQRLGNPLRTVADLKRLLR